MTEAGRTEVEKRLDSFMSEAWVDVLSTERGRMVIWSILSHCHVFESTYTGNAASNFLEGERNVGLHILNDHVFPNDPMLLTQMMQEAGNREDQIERALSQLMENEDE